MGLVSLVTQDTNNLPQDTLFITESVRQKSQDTISESSYYGNMLAHKKISTQNSKLRVSCRSLYASPDYRDA